jgi:hypothetical protein
MSTIYTPSSTSDSVVPTSVEQVETAIARLRDTWTGFQEIHVVGEFADLPPEIASKFKQRTDAEGLFDPATNAVWLMANSLRSPDRAVWVASHEVVGHAGLRMLRDHDVDQAVSLAARNPTIARLAAAIGHDTDEPDHRVNVEEAIAELAAAAETDGYQELERRYNVPIPAGLKPGLRGAAQRAVHAVKSFMGRMVGRTEDLVADTDIVTLIAQVRHAVRTSPAIKVNPADFPSHDSALRFSFVGRKSETADHLTLSRAKDLLEQGRSIGSVRVETGWFPGIDGKWRYEISDDEARLINYPKKESYPDFLARTSKERFGDSFDPEQLSGAALLDYRYFRDDQARKYHERWDTRALDEVLFHPKLYAAYPDLRSVRFKFVDGAAYDGQYLPATDSIAVVLDADEAEALSVTMHEVQHAIQEREGFAKGGNMGADFVTSVRNALEKVNDKVANDVAVWKWQNHEKIQEADRAASIARFGMMYESAQRLINYGNSDSPSGMFRNIRNELQWIHYPEFHKNEDARTINASFWTLPKRHRMNERNSQLRDMAFRGVHMLLSHIPPELLDEFKNDTRKLRSMLNALERESERKRRELMPLHDLERSADSISALCKVTKYQSGYDIYRSLAGEVEARNTQARLKMDEAERARTHPDVTQDIQNKDVIVMCNHLEIRAPLALANLAREEEKSKLYYSPRPEQRSKKPRP